MTARFAGPAILLLLHIAFYWKLVLSNQYTWLDSPDIAHMAMPRFQFMAGEWHHLRFPLWDPHQWNGQPFLGGWTGAAMPLNWPMLIFGGFREGKIQVPWLHWYYVLVHWLGSVFCYWLCRDLGRSRAAAILAGCLFAMGGFFGTTDWPEVFTGVVWTPLAFLFLFRALSGVKQFPNAAMAGMCCGLAWLAGHHQAPYYLTVAAAAVWFGVAAADRNAKLALSGLTMLLFTFATGALQLLPGREFGQLALRWAGAPDPLSWKDSVPFAVHAAYSMRPHELWGVLFPNYGGHVAPLAGAIGILTAGMGLWAFWERREIRILAVVGAAAVLFAMADFNILYGPLYALAPMYEKARVPARTMMLFSFAIAPIAAFGVDALRKQAPARLLRWLVAAAGLAMAAAFLVHAAGKDDFTDRFAGAGVVIGLAAALLRAGGPFMPAGLIALSLIELSQGSLFQPTAPRPDSVNQKLYHHRDLAHFLKEQPGTFRIEVADEIKYNFGDWHQLDSTGGYAAGVTSNIFRSDWFALRVRDMFGVAFSVAAKPMRPDQHEVFTGSSGLKVYRNPGAFPRAWVVHEVRRASTPAGIALAVSDPAVDLRRVAVTMDDAPVLERCEGLEEVRWTERKASRLRFEVETKCRGMVVVSDTWYPGWQAKVDGSGVKIFEVNAALRGVAIGAGRHVVEMRYRPWTFYLGVALSLAGIVGAFLWWRLA